MKISELNTKSFLGATGAATRSYVLLNYEDSSTSEPITYKATIDELGKAIANNLQLVKHTSSGEVTTSVNNGAYVDGAAKHLMTSAEQTALSHALVYDATESAFTLNGNAFAKNVVTYEESQGGVGFFADATDSSSWQTILPDATPTVYYYDGEIGYYNGEIGNASDWEAISVGGGGGSGSGSAIQVSDAMYPYLLYDETTGLPVYADSDLSGVQTFNLATYSFTESDTTQILTFGVIESGATAPEKIMYYDSEEQSMVPFPNVAYIGESSNGSPAIFDCNGNYVGGLN